MYDWSRELHRWRTGILVGGLTALGGVVIARVFNLGQNVQDDAPSGEIDQIVIPIFRLRW